MISDQFTAKTDAQIFTPRNVVICCDGTGNEYGDENSNVVKLYSTLVIHDHQQIGYYHPGVGTMGAPAARTRLEKEWSRLKGLAFGSGILDNVADAYRYLMNEYRDGDRIFLFGFSRGAYTVRVLAGVLRLYGLLCRGNEGHIPYVIRMFAQVRRKAARNKSSVDVRPEDAQFKATFSRNITVHFAGVWDTVSSIGWIYDPVRLPFTGTNHIIRTARQAIALDERRCFYMPLIWARSDANQNLKQVWFTGAHSDVGGSYPEQESGLSKVTLDWMLTQAQAHGLLVSDSKLKCVLGEQTRCAPEAPKYARPNGGGCAHRSLRRAWWLLEFLPHKIDNGIDGKATWVIPTGEQRLIPDGAVIYANALSRLEKSRLPKSYGIEPRTAHDHFDPPAEPAAPDCAQTGSRGGRGKLNEAVAGQTKHLP